MLPLKLERPLAVLDIESTGINPRMDRIIDLAIIKLFPDGRREQHTFRVNPEIPIPAETTAIHHITNADVAHAPAVREQLDNRQVNDAVHARVDARGFDIQHRQRAFQLQRQHKFSISIGFQQTI